MTQTLLIQYGFSHLTLTTAMPLVSAILVLVLAFLVISQNWKSNLNILFGLFSFCISLWLFGTYMLFNSTTDVDAIFWDRFIYIGVIFLPMLLYQFCTAFAGVQPSNRNLVIGYLLTIFFLIVSRTEYFVSGLFKYEWGVHTKAQFFHHLFLIFFVVLTIRSISYLYQQYKTVQDPAEKQRAKYAFIAFVILYSLGPLGFLPGYNISIYPFAYLGGVPFVLILTYTITRYRLFNLKAVAAEIFLFFLSLFFLVRVFLDPASRFLNISLFLIVIIFGFFLIQSAIKEILQREKLQQLSNELADLNTNLQQKVAEQTQEVRKAYEVEKKARIELEELDKAKDQFILTTQHHLRTPLTIIKGFIESALSEEKAPKHHPDVKKYLEKASIASERMAKLINDFLGVSQLEVGKAIFKFQPTDVKKIVENIKEELMPEIEKKKLKFILDFSEEAAMVKANIDPEAIKEALYNLIDNATKYTETGSITVNGVMIIHPIENTKALKVTIKDTGIGIRKEELPHIFTRYFQRGQVAEKMYATGRGIGLVLSKNIIQANHGQIFVESAGEGLGTTFIVELPVAD